MNEMIQLSIDCIHGMVSVNSTDVDLHDVSFGHDYEKDIRVKKLIIKGPMSKVNVILWDLLYFPPEYYVGEDIISLTAKDAFGDMSPSRTIRVFVTNLDHLPEIYFGTKR